MLNRAPTLHRLGIQAFEPVLVEGKAIKIHPLVCTAFNADFDGDQMAVHVPLSAEAQAEARILMLSTNNVLSPAHGRPIATPTQDMVLGLYYLTIGQRGPAKDEDIPAFGSEAEALMALDAGYALHDLIKIRLPGKAVPAALQPEGCDADAETRARPRWSATTVGRVIFNEAFPDEFEYGNHHVQKNDIGTLVGECVHTYDRGTVEHVLDNLKRLGFHYSTRAGVTIGLDDVATPESKAQHPRRHEKRAAKVEQQYRRGIITDDERRQELIEIWTRATDEVQGGHGGLVHPDEPDLHDGLLGRAREHHADPPDRRDARPRGEPEGRDHPAADQGELPRGHDRARVLHLDARRPEGTGRHGASYGRLRVPDPASGRRRAGGHHPRGGLRERPRAAGAGNVERPTGRT